MGVYEGRGQLAKSMKELMARWMEATSQWDDTVSRGIEKSVLQPMESELKSVASAMDHMAVILNQISRDCE